MFYLIDGSIGSKKKVSGKLYNVNRTKYIKYVATPARETFVFYNVDSPEPIGGIVVRSTILKELDTYVESVKSGGEYEDFLQGTGLVQTDNTQWLKENFEEDNVAKGSTVALKQFVYTPLDVASTYNNVSLDELKNKIKNVEDAIYKVRSLREVMLEQNMSLEWLKMKDYRIINTREDYLDLIEEMKNYDDSNLNPMGFDTETSGLLINRNKLDVLVGICLSLQDHTGVYIPFKHLNYKNLDMDMDEALALMKPYIDVNSPTKKGLLTHNGKFDWGVMKMHDIELNIVHDTLTRQAVLNIGKTGTLMKLKKITEDLLGYDVLELEDLYEYPNSSEFLAIKNAVEKGLNCNEITKRKLESVENGTPSEIKNNMFDFRFASEEFSEIYGPADGDFPRLILKEMNKEWDIENAKENGKLDLIYNLEISLIPVLGEQEYFGVKVEKEQFETLHRDTLNDMQTLSDKIFREAGREFKIGGKETAEIVYDVCKVPYNPRYRTKSGSRSVDKFALDYYTQFKDKDDNMLYPITDYLKKYNKKKTLVSSFYSKLPKLVQNSYIFPNYNNIKAETGRLTCSKPNIQQTEPSSREYMIPDSDEFYFMICDYSQVEYRLMNGLAGETKVVEFFEKDKEADYHIMAYSNMHGIPYAKVTSKQRKEGKGLNFGTSYGLQDKALALMLFGDDDEASQMKAHAARTKYFAGVPKVLEYFEQQRDEAQETCYARTKFGRRRFIPQFAEAKKVEGRKKDMLIGKGRRVAGNMPVQGLAADIMKMAMIRIRNNFRKYGYYEDMARMVLNVHDEVCVQLSKDIHPDIAITIMREAMEIDFSDWGLPPLYVGGNVGYNWHDGKADDLEAPVELMDRMVANAKYHLENNIPMERLEDPRKYWAEEIIKFNLEIMDTESKLGYIDPDIEDREVRIPINNLDDALKSTRIAKYATHDAYKVNGISRGNYILGMTMLKGHEYVYANLTHLLQDGTSIALANLNKLVGQNLTFEEAKAMHPMRTCAEYFGDTGGGEVMNYIVTKNLKVLDVSLSFDSSYNTVATILDEKNNTVELVNNNHVLKHQPPKLYGQELQEQEQTLKQEVDSMFVLDNNRLTIHADKIEPKTLSLIFNLFMEPRQVQHMLKDSQKPLFNVEVAFDSIQEDTHIANKVLVSDFLEPIRKLVYSDIVGENIFNEIDKEISTIATTIFNL